MSTAGRIGPITVAVVESHRRTVHSLVSDLVKLANTFADPSFHCTLDDREGLLGLRERVVEHELSADGESGSSSA